MINMAATDMSLKDNCRPPKERPTSAPITKFEEKVATLSAGETDEYVEKKILSRPATCKPRIYNAMESEDEEIS